MKYLGTGTLELGPHLFSNTTFYEAKRSIPWTTIAKEQGLNIFHDDDTDNLEFIDIVFELNEIPNERFVFPKEALVSLSVEDGPIEVIIFTKIHNKKLINLSFMHRLRYLLIQQMDSLKNRSIS